MRKLIILSFAFIFSIASAHAQNDALRELLQKLNMAVMATNHLYVDSVDETKLVEDAIKGMLKELDPHSTYTTAKQTKSMTEPLKGSFDGIGVQFNMAQDTLLVIQTVSNGPSEKIGILAGDRIVMVNDTVIAGVKMEREEIMRRLRGPKGTIANLKVIRRGIPGLLTFKVKRDKIPVTTLDASYMIRPGVGYVRFSSFGATTYDEFKSSVDSLKQHGMTDLIIDLQDNGGGLLQTAVDIVNELLPANDLIVYTEGRKVPRQDCFADGTGSLAKGKIVVLVNEYSASASEILSGAVQDQDRGVIVGRRTFGKGLVQRPIEFNDGSMIRLTIAHYHTPSGRCIQKPYEKGDKEEYEHDIEKRFKHGELYCKDSIQFADSLKYYTLKKKRVVYGGGGIMPDYFVPLDTTQYTMYHRKIVAKSVIINQTLKYVDSNRKKLKKDYKTFADFKSQFEVPDNLMEAIFEEGEKEKVTFKDEEEKAKTIPTLKTQIKALIARDIWTMSEYFEIMNEQNHIVQKAIEVLSEEKQ